MLTPILSSLLLIIPRWYFCCDSLCCLLLLLSASFLCSPFVCVDTCTCRSFIQLVAWDLFSVISLFVNSIILYMDFQDRSLALIVTVPGTELLSFKFSLAYLLSSWMGDVFYCYSLQTTVMTRNFESYKYVMTKIWSNQIQNPALKT